MSRDRSKKAPARPVKKTSPPPRRPAATAEMQPISPLALVGAIAAALLIAAVLLFVINTRINAAKPTPVPATPTLAARPATATPATGATAATAPTATQASASAVTQTGGFGKGNAQAKVTFTEFADFK